jgi:hypothetical protein
MPGTTIRTADELKRARWADKFTSVSEGKQYTTEDDPLSPFPIHSYFQNKLLGKQIKMLEINAGTALIEHFVNDTLTDMKITVDGDQTTDIEKKIQEWFNEIDYEDTLEETCRNLYGNGYGVQQIIRTQENAENGYTVVTVDPATWYPDIPLFSWQKVQTGRIISVFPNIDEKGNKTWYAFVERHIVGQVQYELYRMEHEASLEGTKVGLSELSQFAELQNATTELPYIPILQADRQKSSRRICGTSLLYPIWDILQEVSEAQTQIRQERIKHLRARLAVPERSLTQVDRDRVGAPLNSKQQQAMANTNAKLFDVNQEILPVRDGNLMPQYIQRDLQSITLGIELIDSLLGKAAAIVGCPKALFNLDEPSGNIKVETDKRKDRRYVRKVLQAQRQMAVLVQRTIETWLRWNGTENAQIRVDFESPFNLSREETVNLMREMNPTATFISEEDAVNEIFNDKTPEERSAILAKIQAEKPETGLQNPLNIAA